MDTMDTIAKMQTSLMGLTMTMLIIFQNSNIRVSEKHVMLLCATMISFSILISKWIEKS